MKVDIHCLYISRLSFLRIPKFILLVLMQVPDANARSANSSFDNYLINQTIQETWDMAQEDVISYLYAYSLLLCIYIGQASTTDSLVSAHVCRHV